MPTILDQRIAESDIFLNSLEGLKSVLGSVAVDYGKPPIPIAFVPSSFSQREIGQQFGGSFTYPFIAITLQRINVDPESYNSNLRRTGISVASGDKIFIYKLTPVIATFRVRYITQDNAELLKFSSRWIRRQKDTQFALENSALNIKIKVRLNNDLSIPELDIADWGNQFALETDCEIKTYIGEVETQTRIKKVVLTTNLYRQSNMTPMVSSVRTFKLSKPDEKEIIQTIE